MNNNYIVKINRIGKIGHTLAKICIVMIYIAIVCCIVGGVLLALVPQESVLVTTSHRAQIEMDMFHSIMPSLVGIEKEADGNFELDGIKYDQFEITGNMAKQTAVAKSTPYTYSLKDMLWVIVASGILCLAILNAFKKISALFGIFKNCETPFTIEIADHFKKIVISFIPVIVMSWAVKAVAEWVTTGVIYFTIGVDLTVVMAILVMLMMSEIFRYGTMLQTESDETL